MSTNTNSTTNPPETPSNPNPSTQDLEELQTLRLLRATFQSIKQLIENIHTDLEILGGNYQNISGLTKRWDEILDSEEIDGDGKD